MEIVNETPFEAGLRLTTDKTGAELVVAAVKATFIIPSNGEVPEIAEDQVEVFETDVPFDTFENSGIKYPADLVPNKQATDIGFCGSAWSRKPAKKLTALLRVGNNQKKLKVFGDRYWNKIPLLPLFYKTAPEPFLSIPMTSDRVFGGTDSSHKDEKKHKAYEENQHGTGFFKYRKTVKGSRLPNFEKPGNLVSSWRSKPPIGTFGFSPETAKHRRKYAGTYDKNWEESQYPLPPLDFNERFFNCAQPELISKGYLKGGESVEFKNLSKKGDLKFLLPENRVKIKFFMVGQEEIVKTPNIYNVVFEPDENSFYITYAVTFCIGKRPTDFIVSKAFMDE